MANLKSSQKRIRSNERKRVRNVAVRTNIKTEVKRVEQAIEQGNYEVAKKMLSEVSSTLDSASIKGIIKKNTGSRNKSRLAKKINDLQTSA
ncbi:MAG: small subunit ribosomal protein [Candidatus Poribacteria bacterium]|nr:small subunit ribosomal protein [Candidatus Poribacteria bacterium]